MGRAPALNPKPHGAPVSISPTRVARLLSAIAGGNYITVSCNYANVSTQTYRNWQNIGEREIERVRLLLPDDTDPETIIGDWIAVRSDNTDPQRRFIYGNAQHPIYTDPGPDMFSRHYWLCVLFLTLLRKADAEAEVQAVAQIQLAARNPNHWQAAMTFLERRHPDRWRRQDRMGVEGVQGGAPIQTQVIPTTDDLVAKITTLRIDAEQQKALGS